MCTKIEPWVCFSNTSTISPPSPSLLLLALPCDVSTHLHSARCLLCQWQENWQLLPMLNTEWFRQGSKCVRSVVVPSCPIFPTFFSLQCRLFCLAPLPCFFGHGDLHRCQIGCSCFADDCFCMFLVCFRGFPDSIMPTELSFKCFHLLRQTFLSPNIVVLISSLDSNSFRIQTRSTSSPDTTKSSPCTRKFKLLW